MMTTAARPRDAAQTRTELLRAARVRFARDGYRSTTVRDIAADAGVNVALISRYFDSKDGLFEACLASVGEELKLPETEAPTLERVARSLVRQVTGFSSDQLLLLLRTSGDERADGIRRRILRTFAEKTASVAGWTPDSPDSERLLLRAEIVLSAALGMTQLRSTGGLEPLSSATEQELVEPVLALLTELLG